MLNKKKRIKSPLFKEVFNNSKVFSSSNFSLLVSDGGIGEVGNRFAVSVPKKVANNAPERNLIKRRIYSVFQKIENKIKTKILIICLVKKGAKSLSFRETEEELVSLFEKSKILR